MRSFFKLVSSCAVLLLTVLSCSEPESSEVFVWNTGNPYRFEVDMSRSDCVYDISFYTRIDSMKKVAGFPMEIRWISPSGNIFSEEVYFDCSEHSRVLYRKGLSPIEQGVWTLEARADAEGMTGLGLICERTN